MRAGIYNPYLDTLGGGERYTATFAKVLADLGYRVDIEWNKKAIKKKLENRFGINLEGVEIVKDVNRGDGYDICFWVSDGSIPTLRARRNFLHFQFPFKDVGGKSLFNKMKLFRIEKAICNSYFTKKFIDTEFGIKSTVIYPPVDVGEIKPRKKENVILSVGRFSKLTQAKGQDVLVDVFKKLHKKLTINWRLILAGGTEVGVDKDFHKFKKKIEGFPIEIIESPSFDKLKQLYGKAKVFWSASGYGVDEVKEPKRVEHFGIANVEAMSAGAVPLLYKAGGHKEIIADGKNGYLWKRKTELLKMTKELIENRELMSKLSKRAVNDSKIYEYERYQAEVKSIVQK